MKREKIAEQIYKENRSRSERPEDREKEVDLEEVAERRGHLGRKITIRVKSSRGRSNRRGKKGKR